MLLALMITKKNHFFLLRLYILLNILKIFNNRWKEKEEKMLKTEKED